MQIQARRYEKLIHADKIKSVNYLNQNSYVTTTIIYCHETCLSQQYRAIWFMRNMKPVVEPANSNLCLRRDVTITVQPEKELIYIVLHVTLSLFIYFSKAQVHICFEITEEKFALS